MAASPAHRSSAKRSLKTATPLQASHYAVFGCDLHGQLPRNKSLQDNALTAIVGEVMN
jgi:hypothetical protein